MQVIVVFLIRKPSCSRQLSKAHCTFFSEIGRNLLLKATNCFSNFVFGFIFQKSKRLVWLFGVWEIVFFARDVRCICVCPAWVSCFMGASNDRLTTTWQSPVRLPASIIILLIVMNCHWIYFFDRKALSSCFSYLIYYVSTIFYFLFSVDKIDCEIGVQGTDLA